MVGLAVVLRHALLQFLPPDVPINGEEIQMGGDSMLIVLGADLPVSYRFTVIMGMIGFEFTDNSLDALRVVFRLAGSLSIVVLALTLRRLSIGWPATLLAVFTMSSLSLLVVGGGVAYENFSGIIFEVLLLYCVVGATTSRDNALVWAGFAGLFGGVLMHEFDSFKAIVILPPLFWFVRSVLTEEPECRRSALRSGGMYIILLTLTGAAAFADLVNNPTTSSLVDGLRRHSLERGIVFAGCHPLLAEFGQTGVELYSGTFRSESAIGSGSFQNRRRRSSTACPRHAVRVEHPICAYRQSRAVLTHCGARRTPHAGYCGLPRQQLHIGTGYPCFAYSGASERYRRRLGSEGSRRSGGNLKLISKESAGLFHSAYRADCGGKCNGSRQDEFNRISPERIPEPPILCLFDDRRGTPGVRV